MNKNYGGVIWTNHALSRMQEREITQGDAWATWRRPDQSRNGKSKGTWVYYRNYAGRMIEVVAKKNDIGKWIILSVWSRPANRKSVPQKSLLSKILKKIFR